MGLVYIAAFALDKGETIGALLAQDGSTPALTHLKIDDLGLAWMPQDDYVNHFAADVDPIQAKVMYATQQPLAASTLQDVMGVPSWKSLPSWYMAASRDDAIPPAVERMLAPRMKPTTSQVPSRHFAIDS